VALVVAGVTLIAALGGFWWSRGVPAPPARDSPASSPVESGSDAELAALREALSDEVFAREQLAAEVELMRAVLAELTQPGVGGDVSAPVDDSPTPEPAEGRLTEAERFEEALIEFGFVARELKALRGRWDQAQLERLELTDRAMREGWLHRPRHRRLIDQIDARMRLELGDEEYERMLIATGQPNQIRVRAVLGGSAAADAGVQVGDHLIAYAGRRVFSPKDVRKATAGGTKGESVQLRVERAGRSFSFVVPRGPLGLQMSVGKTLPR